MGCCGSNPLSILILGVGSAGKTTVLYNLIGQPKENTVPTHGFISEEAVIFDRRVEFWDLGGQDRVRPLWKHYFSSINGIIFVIDSMDESLYSVVIDELTELASNESIKKVPMVIFANKQDLEGCRDKEYIREKIGVDKLLKNNKFEIFETSGKTGVNVKNGMKWLLDNIK